MNIAVEINTERCAELASAVKTLKFKADDFTDPLLFPSKKASKEAVVAYFFFMVAIDHRTSSPDGKAFEGNIDGKILHGSDLLYALAIKKQQSDPAFFTAEKMHHISEQDVADWLSAGEVTIYDPGVRAVLLRDCSKKLMKHHGGSVLTLLKAADGYLIRADGKGLLQQLSEFKAYSDPLSKKSFLLIKFLERRKLFKIKDHWNLHVPVDSVLARIALRAGIIEVKEGKLEEKLRQALPVNEREDRVIRSAAQKAFDLISRKSGLGVTVLDDLLWTMGRACCQREKPVCGSCVEKDCRAAQTLSIKCGQKCVFVEGCRGAKEQGYREYREPKYKTWYY